MSIIKIELYNSREALPKNGWFQQCFTCDTITSSTIIYSSKKYTTKYIFEVYVCPDCQKKICKKENNTIFAKKCENYIHIKLSKNPLNQSRSHLLKSYQDYSPE